MRTLIVSPAWIGDSVMSLPLLQRLRDTAPGGAIDVLAPRWVAPVYRHSPCVDRTIESPFVHGKFDLAGRWRLGRHLRATGYRRAIVLPNTWKSALVPFFAGIPERIGFRGESRSLLLNRITALDESRMPRLVQRYAALAYPDGASETIPAARLVVSALEVDATFAALRLNPATPAVAFCPGAEFGPAKRWPVRYFAALAESLELAGFDVWLLGADKDHRVGEQIADAAGKRCINLCGRTTLDQAMAVLSRASLVVSNDSGLMHVAAALDRPLIGLFGSSSPDYTPPHSSSAEVIWLGVDCSPCFARVCPYGHLKCLDGLTPDRVLESAMRKLGIAGRPLAKAF